MILVLLSLLVLTSTVNGDVRSARVRRIVGGKPAKPPPVDDPVVFTRFGGKAARIEGVRDFPHYVFRGVRYGLPPVGKERFLRPKQYFLQGFENATKFPAPCIQPLPGQDKVVGNEDCLFLNVFTPELPSGFEGLPVIVWIHGGNFRYGSASQYGVRHLVGKRVVVVTIQYRLGSLGFLSTGSKTLPGNAALWDMVLAVQWTRNYIGFFGGNPYNIVVMGHGSGASSALLVALSNVAKGLASGVIAMSGSSVSHFAVDDAPRNTAMEVADANGCPTGSELTMVRCLQNLSPSSIIKVDSFIEAQRLRTRGFISGLAGGLGAAPVYEGRRDGRSLPPLSELEPLNDPENAHTKIPLLTGITKHETKRACQTQFKDEIVQKLKTVPDFVDKVVVQRLQNVLGLENLVRNSSRGLWGLLDPKQFKAYLQYRRGSFMEGLGKISEATSDALFNVPAFLTVEAWSKRKAPAFLYQFEHIGRKAKGYSFLRGVPLIGNSSQADSAPEIVSHGDELSYIFDAHGLDGQILFPQEPSDEDKKVTEVFTQMISDFARSGKLILQKQEVPPFSIGDNNFVQISQNSKIMKNFKYCEMALWVGLVERLQSSTCSLYKTLENLPTLLGNSNIGLSKLMNGAEKAQNTLPKRTNALNSLGFNFGRK